MRHVLLGNKQNEEKSLEGVLQRVTVTIDGYSDAHNATLQQQGTEAFLRGCKFKDAATLVMNEAQKSIQEACRRVKTFTASKKTMWATKVSFQKCALRYRRKTGWPQKMVDLVETLHRTNHSYRSSSRSPSRYSAGPQSNNIWPRLQSTAGNL